ncbi:MAG: radical SAM family protein [Planctomycetota bacterium]|jgi:DNA repair photolyase
MGKKRLTGTREWAPNSDNCAVGCEHNCRYCYARYNAVHRFKRVRADHWPHPRIDLARTTKKRKRLKGAVMFPTQHDITPKTLQACMTVIELNLRAGNRMLIVSKPHLYCIHRIMWNFHQWRDMILFRFTIGTTKDEILRFWEPGAPCYDERRACLELAWEKEWQTSVSAEPLLLPTVEHARALVADLEGVVSQSIWIGTLNKASQRIVHDTGDVAMRLQPILDGQTKDNMRAIYEALKDHPLVRWKDSYKKLLGLTEQECSESEE